MYSVEEQLSVLSPQQLEELKQELIRQRDEEIAGGNDQRIQEDKTQSNKRETRAILAKGLVRGMAAFGEGALLGFQGRPISEHSAYREQPSNKYEELLKMEQLKNVVDPSRIKAQQDIEDAKRKRQVLERKLREQQGIDTIDIEAKNPRTIEQPAAEVSPGSLLNEQAPPQRIKIGEDENGLWIFGDNPARKIWEDEQKEERQVEEKIAEEERASKRKISEEERSVDLIARKASEKDRQLNIGKIKRLTNLVDLVETEYGKTKTPEGITGLIRRPAETFTRGLQITENQRQDKAYADFIKGMRVQLARALSEVGNLSEPEQKAAMDLVPSLLDDPRTAAIKIKQLRNLVLKVQSQPREGQNESIPEVGQTFNGERVLSIKQIQ